MTEIDAIVSALVQELERRSKVAEVNSRTDSVEIGTPSKGGVLKVYFDSGEPWEKIEARITMAAEALRYANDERGRVLGDGQ
jgi:hypothetical protein